MTEQKDLLVEIGTEEMPPAALQALGLAFLEGMKTGLRSRGLDFSETSWYATPRRLAVIVDKLDARQADREVLKRGPALNAAFDKSGKPTPAAEGFARSCAVDVELLEILETEKGKWLSYRLKEAGQETTTLLQGIINEALARLPVPRRMRWGNGDVEFVRPVHWTVVLFGREALNCEILGTTSGRHTHGHRFHHPGAIKLGSAAEYVRKLHDKGKVIAGFPERRKTIEDHIRETAQQEKVTAVIDADLLDEVTALVEWPVPVAAGFDEKFLQLPDEVLIACMQHQQKYFPARDSSGNLCARFICMANIDSKNPEEIARGNERVIRPRLSDAAFFMKQDCKQPLEDFATGLHAVVFEQKLGSLRDRTDRIATLSAWLAGQLRLDVDSAKRAAMLSKCDLLTDMVGEFPELQGVMGRVYAGKSGETDSVAVALDEQYRPRFSGDTLPASPCGRVLALADRLDTIVGIFAIGREPSGEKDPYALRRAAIGCLRIIIECELELDLAGCIAEAAGGYPAEIDAGAVQEKVMDFMLERLRRYYLDNGTDSGIFDAVLSVRPTAPLDFHKRVLAVTGFSKLPEAGSLSAANKRIGNILKQAGSRINGELDTDLLQEGNEKQLAAELDNLQENFTGLMAQSDYNRVLTSLAGLRDVVDNFFDNVMVMCDDEKLRNNRLALLKNLQDKFMAIADISRLQK